jgi:hypothetical protein
MAANSTTLNPVWDANWNDSIATTDGRVLTSYFDQLP